MDEVFTEDQEQFDYFFNEWAKENEGEFGDFQEPVAGE